MRLKKYTGLTLGLLVLTLMVSGCGKKKGELTLDDYRNMYNQKVAEVDKANSQNSTLKKLLYTFDKNLAEVQDLTDFEILPTGKTAYVQMHDVITFNNKLDLGQSVVVPNQSKINITNNVFFTPSQNWTVSVGNGSIKMSHSSGIYCEIEVYSYNGNSNAYSVYDDVIKPHLQSIQAEELTKRVLFLGSNAGTSVESRLYVKETLNKSTGVKSNEVTQTTEETLPETVESTEAVESTVSVETIADETGAEGEVSSTEVSTEAEETESNLVETVIPYRYICGVAIGDYSDIPDAVVFKFFYPESSDLSSSSEIVNNTLKSIVVGDNSITME